MKKEFYVPEILEKKLDIKKDPLILTIHAMGRFKKRWKPLDEFDLIPENEEEWKEKLEFLVRDSEEVTLKRVFRIRRLIKNDFEDVRYFYNKAHNLRFVMREENGFMVIKTVEIPKINK